jgi:hypothetical protein
MRASVKLFLGAALLFTVCALSIALYERRLPRIPLKGGGEVRIIKVDYGETHTFGSRSEMLNKLDRWIPEFGEWDSFGRMNKVPTLAIYWGWWDPGERRIVICPTGKATLLLSSGEQQEIDFDQVGIGDIRVFSFEPPRTERRLRIRMPVNYELVEFEVPNPVYSAEGR